jgi:hypothetical protein
VIIRSHVLPSHCGVCDVHAAACGSLFVSPPLQTSPPLPDSSTMHPTAPRTHTSLGPPSPLQAVPLVIGQFLELVDNHTGIVGSTTGSNYYVRILSTLNRELLKPSASVALHRCGGPGWGWGVFVGVAVGHSFSVPFIHPLPLVSQGVQCAMYNLHCC